MLGCWECDFVDFLKMLISHVNAVIQFETFIDRTIIVKIWIVGIDILFGNIRSVVDIGHTISLTCPFDLVVELVSTQTKFFQIFKLISTFDRKDSYLIVFCFKNFYVWKLNEFVLTGAWNKSPFSLLADNIAIFGKVVQGTNNCDRTDIIHGDQLCFSIKLVSTRKLTWDDFILEFVFNILVFWNSHNCTSIFFFLLLWFYHKHKENSSI